MFTGIIKLIGVVDSVESLTDGVAVVIACKTADLAIQVGDSIAVNGVCSTVVTYTDANFTVHYLQETLRVTTFGSLVPGSYVNLESSLTLATKLSGHYVSGHIDGTAQISSIETSSPWSKLVITYTKELAVFLIYKGSITIDGVSLTIAELTDRLLTCYIIPHTFDETILQYYEIGQYVNIECDMIGKYVVNAVKQGILNDKV